MKEYVPVLKKTKMFAGVGDAEITSMLSCPGASLRTYKKGWIRAAGGRTSQWRGRVQIHLVNTCCRREDGMSARKAAFARLAQLEVTIGW